MKRILLIFGALLVLHQGQVATADWMSDLMASINQMNGKLQTDIQRMNQEIQANVNSQVAKANADIAEAIKKIPKDGITTGQNTGQSIIVSGRSGNLKTIQSGTDSNGNPYFVESENLVVGDTLFHTDRTYNYTTKQIDEMRYTLNLSDPNAKPVYSKLS